MVDEYDNFANSILSQDLELFKSITPLLPECHPYPLILLLPVLILPEMLHLAPVLTIMQASQEKN